MTISLICPADHAMLSEDGPDAMRCTACGRVYPIDDGVVRLLGETDAFYEGAYLNQVSYVPRSERPWHALPLWLLVNGYPWMVRQHVPAGASVVELGCASGVAYFAHRYRMAGCDLSHASLKALPYQQKVQCDAGQCLPLPDASVDAVVSSYFWEHIPPDIKPAILRECRRILKPGGKIIFLYDVETENPLIRRYKKADPALYKTLFIDGDGHLGYERPRDNFATFRDEGFRPVARRGMEKTWLQSPAAYMKLRQFGSGRNPFLRLGALFARSPWFYAYTGIMRVVDSTVCRLLPEDWARIELVVCERTED
ncbi:SAM-dependent methyltransferase [Amorphus suaedae]